MMYYYELKIKDDDPYDSLDTYCVTLSSEKEYSDFEFNSIVQDCIDECIDLYCGMEVYKGKQPCDYSIDELLSRFNLPTALKKRGINICYITSCAELECGRIFSENFKNEYLFERYKDKTLGKCYKCDYKKYNNFDGCPVPHKRRTNRSDDKKNLLKILK